MHGSLLIIPAPRASSMAADGRAVERGVPKCMGAGSCTVFRTPSDKTPHREALGKAYINLRPYTQGLGNPPVVKLSVSFKFGA
jgi:hypothetical protein